MSFTRINMQQIVLCEQLLTNYASAMYWKKRCEWSIVVLTYSLEPKKCSEHREHQSFCQYSFN